MKSKIMFGALLLSVALCAQGFGIELGQRMLGLGCGGCGGCEACAKVACCQPAAKACCPEPACCEKACAPACGCNATPVRDLFCGLKGVFACKQCGCGTCAPVKACTPEPACCEKAACGGGCHPLLSRLKSCGIGCGAGPACCEKAAPCCEKAAPVCCEKAAPCCEKRCCRRPLQELVNNLFACRRCKSACGCEAGCGEAGCGCGGGSAAPAAAPTTAPGKTPEAPLPKAPKAEAPKSSADASGIDSSSPSTSLMRVPSAYQASRAVVRN
jgi:hypothetical protein